MTRRKYSPPGRKRSPSDWAPAARNDRHGAQHRAPAPSTHGVLRLRLVVNGERIVTAEPIVGYMHGAQRNCSRCVTTGRSWLWPTATTGCRGSANDSASPLASRPCSAWKYPSVPPDPHAVGRAHPHPEPPDVPWFLPARAGCDHSDLLLVPRARGASGSAGGGHGRASAPPCSIRWVASKRTCPLAGLGESTRPSRLSGAACPTLRASSSATRSYIGRPAGGAILAQAPGRHGPSGRRTGSGSVSMNISEPFIRKPVATTLMVAAIALAGVAAYRLLPVSPLPQVEFPTISVNAGLPGPVPRPWPHRWRRRWSASSDGLRRSPR